MRSKNIIALGGGGFSMEPENTALDLYVLRAAEAARPKVCFLPHAASDEARYCLNFFTAFARYDCTPSSLSLFTTPPKENMESFLHEQDVIYVGGGNTKSMLAVWREWELDRILRSCYEHGVVLAGVSAGANCWFDAYITDSASQELGALTNGLGLIGGTFCPHYNGEEQRRPTFHQLVANGTVPDGIACDDSVAAHFKDGQLHVAVASNPYAQAFHVRRTATGVTEESISTHHLDTTS